MKTKIVRIGNSRGVRIPKSFIDEAGLEMDVEMRVVESGILIEASTPRRSGWAEAAAQLKDRGDDGLLDEPTLTDFDDTEWTWE